MKQVSPDSLERLGPAELIGLVRRLLGEVEQLGEANEKLNATVTGLRLENQQLKGECVDHCCFNWNKLVERPWLIMSIGIRQWTHGFGF